MKTSEIKSALSRTWHPFFSRFGKFLPIQKVVIPHILNYENVVVISPAASGKTEAVIAPLIENLFTKKITFAQVRILYISPTRALVNDLFKRLVDPVAYTGLTIAIKTGDKPVLNYKKLPDILLTTPESFDSLLTRHPRIFTGLMAVVLDEIHLLDNTPRGDQLRVLLNRLRRICKPLHYCALSATIDDRTIGERYFEDPKVCMLKQERQIDYILLGAEQFTEQLLDIIKTHQLQKILIFFNARSLVEVFSQKLKKPPFQDMILVHHASLERQVRQQVETQMNRRQRAILCATATLELGIDIGDIDCVVLYRPPYDIASLLQRIGRGNRRTDRLFSIGVYVNNWEKLLFETFFDCAKKGQLFSKRYQPSLSVIPQQIYSYLYQRRRIGTTLASVERVLQPVFSKQQIEMVFKELLTTEQIKELRPGIYYDSFKLENRIRWGRIHSNIAEVSFGEYNVINNETNQLIGRIFYLKKRFVLAGKCWELMRVDENDKKIYAQFIGELGGEVKIFEGKGAGNYCYLLAPIIKKRILPGAESFYFPYYKEHNQIYILHFFGQLYGFLIADALGIEGVEAFDIEGKVLIVNEMSRGQEKFPVPGSDAVRSVIKNNIARLEDTLGSGAYFYDLPLKYQVEDHYLNLDIDGFLAFISQIRLYQISKKEFHRLQTLFSS